MKNLIFIAVLFVCLSSCFNFDNDSDPTKETNKENLPKEVSFINEHGTIKTMYIYRIGACQYLGRSAGTSDWGVLTHKGDCDNPIHIYHSK